MGERSGVIDSVNFFNGIPVDAERLVQEFTSIVLECANLDIFGTMSGIWIVKDCSQFIVQRYSYYCRDGNLNNSCQRIERNLKVRNKSNEKHQESLRTSIC